MIKFLKLSMVFFLFLGSSMFAAQSHDYSQEDAELSETLSYEDFNEYIEGVDSESVAFPCYEYLFKSHCLANGCRWTCSVSGCPSETSGRCS